MERIKPFWRIVIGFLIFDVCVYYSNMIAYGDNWFAFSFWWAVFVAYVFLAVKVKYDDPLRSMRDIVAQQVEQKASAAKTQQADRVQALIKKEEAAKKRMAAERAEWEAHHGRIITPIAGVTFDNDDKTSRQRILKDLMATGGDIEITLDTYDYNGSPAIHVIANDMCIGNIPKKQVKIVLDVLDLLESGTLSINTFRPEEEIDDEGNIKKRGELIYRADLTLVYKKSHDLQ